jgi:O-antigen ligase
MQNTVQADGSFDNSTKARLEVWKAADRMIRANPMVGVGYDNFQYYVEEYGLPPNVHGIDAHNTYLLYAAEMGVPAAACFVIILLFCGWKGLYIWRKTNDKFFKTAAIGFLGGLTGLMASNIFGSRLNSNEIVFQFWILIAVIMRMAEIAKVDYERLTEISLEYHRRSLRSKMDVLPARYQGKECAE